MRKQGNLSLYSEKIIRPVQRPSNCQKRNVLSNDFLPCMHCNGLYTKRSLSRHVKCFFNNKSNNLDIRYGIVSFTESRRAFLNRLHLKDEVFTKMHPGRISLNGKKDPIACQYAEDYLRKHKRPHIKNLVGNKLRELGRLLIPLQDIYQIDSFLEALKPENFNKVVSASRIIAGYKIFQSPFIIHAPKDHSVGSLFSS